MRQQVGPSLYNRTRDNKPFFSQEREIHLFYCPIVRDETTASGGKAKRRLKQIGRPNGEAAKATIAQTLCVILGAITLVLILVQDVILASSLSWKTMIVILGSIIDPVIAAYVHRGVWGAKEG